MKITVGPYTLENDEEIKLTLDGWEIFRDAVKKYDINPADFENAHWADDSIIVRH